MSKKRKRTKRSKRAAQRRARRKLTFHEAEQRFPDDATAEQWFERSIWGRHREDRHCPHCGCTNRLKAVPNRRPMPYFCRNCGRHFNIRTGTVMASSKIGHREWAIAIWLFIHHRKGISSAHLAELLGISQRSAWFLTQRIRQGFGGLVTLPFKGPVEVDETYLGGKADNYRGRKKLRLKQGRGPVNKEIVVGMRDRKTGQIRLKHIPNTKKKTLHQFVHDHAAPGAKLYTDEHKSYQGLPNHETVQHKKREFSRGKVSTNGIESVWALLKRDLHGTYHHWSKQHLQLYLDEVAGRHNIKDEDTMEQMRLVANSMVGQRLRYHELVGRCLRRQQKRRKH